jgi:hypothetical protein
MCGLSGYIGSGIADANALKILLIDNETRGVHATGIANISGAMYKDSDIPREFICTEEFHSVAKSNLVLIHNRWATSFNHQDPDCAHPFMIEKRIIGAHNGFIPEWRDQAKRLRINILKIDVDSEIVFQYLYQNDGNPKCLHDIEGAMALTWVDLKHKILWIYRRSSRPLYIADIGNNQKYFSSRKEGLWMINALGVKEIEEDIAYGFGDNGVLKKMVKVKPALMSLPANCSSIGWRDSMNTDEIRERLGFQPKSKGETEYSRWADNRRAGHYWGGDSHYSRYNEMEYYSRMRNSHYTDDDEDAGSCTQVTLFDKKGKKVSNKKDVDIGVKKAADILVGKLEHVADLTIDDFPEDKKHNIQSSSATKSKVDGNVIGRMMVQLKSSFDGDPIQHAIVFIDGDESRKFVTSELGVVATIIPSEHLGKLLRIAVMPYPYDQLYHTKLLHLEGGEIMEVSLTIPFRPSDRSKAEEEREAQVININTKSDDGSGERGVRKENRSYSKGVGDAPLYKTKSFGNKEESELVDLDWVASRGVREESEDNEGDGISTGANKKEDDDKNAEKIWRGFDKERGKLVKRIDEENDVCIITNMTGVELIQMPISAYRQYAYEYFGIQKHCDDIVGLHSDETWAYNRYLGNSIESLCATEIMSPNDYVHLSMIEEESRDLVMGVFNDINDSIERIEQVDRELESVVNRLNRK